MIGVERHAALIDPARAALARHAAGQAEIRPAARGVLGAPPLGVSLTAFGSGNVHLGWIGHAVGLVVGAGVIVAGVVLAGRGTTPGS